MTKIKEPYDSPLRWLVESSTSTHKPYMVDLGAYNGNGECQCKYWQCNVGPKVKSGTPANCKHIRIARERFTNWAIQAFKQHDQNQKHDKKELGI